MERETTCAVLSENRLYLSPYKRRLLYWLDSTSAERGAYCVRVGVLAFFCYYCHFMFSLESLHGVLMLVPAVHDGRV